MVWLGSEHLIHYGTEHETAALLQEFLGKPVSSEDLLNEIRSLSR